ncbi:MAG: hypothetical protein INQ03_11910 [Candidatus Heimdallarchaeota archaeon]|nr:hypothetical protein [Candidatus Heimdallarchaeota archaeon]
MVYSFLGDIDAPQHLKFSHNLIEYMKKLDFEINEREKPEVKQQIEDIVKIEKRFDVARFEYERKQQRFIDNTLWTENKIDISFSSMQLQFKEVPHQRMKDELDQGNIRGFLDQLEKAKRVIEQDIKICTKRTKFLLDEWEQINAELDNRLRSFEFKSMKKVSSSLRVRLLPIIDETKQNLKLGLVEGVMNRVEIKEKIEEWLRMVKEDIYGDLSDKQIHMLEQLNETLEPIELINFLTEEETRKDLIYLLSTEKIRIQLTKIIDDLI